MYTTIILRGINTEIIGLVGVSIKHSNASSKHRHDAKTNDFNSIIPKGGKSFSSCGP